MYTPAGEIHGGSEAVTGVSAFQSINKLFYILWLSGLRNRLTNGNRGFLLFDCFSFMVYLLIVVIDDKEHRIHYYFL